VGAGVSRPAEDTDTNSVAVADVSGTVEECASCSDDAIDDDRHSIVVTGRVKGARACNGGVVS